VAAPCPRNWEAANAVLGLPWRFPGRPPGKRWWRKGPSNLLPYAAAVHPGTDRQLALEMESRARKSRAINSSLLGTRYTVGTLDNVGAVAYLGGGAHV
jgi:hypothetical protein